MLQWSSLSELANSFKPFYFSSRCCFTGKEKRPSSLSLVNNSQLQRQSLVLACQVSAEAHQTSIRWELFGYYRVSETIVGVLGGGQLGRMLCQAASKMAIKVIVLDPLVNCPASSIAHDHIVGSFDDSTTIQEFTKRCGVLTVEIEHVDVATLEKLEQLGVDCQPKASTIRIIPDKYLQKVHFSQHGIPLPEFMQVRIVSAHRTPEMMFSYALAARYRGVQIIIAGAGGATHLPGMVASLTTLPVIGVPVRASALDGIDSLLSIVEMPRGVPVSQPNSEEEVTDMAEQGG